MSDLWDVANILADAVYAAKDAEQRSLARDLAQAREEFASGRDNLVNAINRALNTSSGIPDRIEPAGWRPN